MKKFIVLSALLFSLAGCAKISPLSPENNQKINNQNGKIDEIKTNQNGLMLEIMKLKNEQQIQAEKIESVQQGFANFKQTNQNSGIQILQGDGALTLIFGLGVIAMLLIFHYRELAQKHQKTAEIFAQQIALQNDPQLEERVYQAALNTKVERNVYTLLQNHQGSTS